MRNIKISINNNEFYAELIDSVTTEEIVKSLPIECPISKWGDEIYFRIDAKANLENDAKSELNSGDLAYWPSMPVFCIFYGPTPMSEGSQPVAAAPVNVFGKLKDFDKKELQSVHENDIIKVELI